MEKLTKEEMNVWRQYSKMKGSNIHRCGVNRLNIHLNDGLEHERTKFELFYQLRTEGHKVITEAWNREGNRRDLVDLTTEEIYEIEDSKVKRGRRHPKNINVFWYDLQRARTLEEAQKDEEAIANNECKMSKL